MWMDRRQQDGLIGSIDQMYNALVRDVAPKAAGGTARLLASLARLECHGLVELEAMMAGRVVAATATAGGVAGPVVGVMGSID